VNPLSRQRRRRRRGPAEYPAPRKTRLPFPINLIFNVKAFYVFFIVVMIASMAAVGLGVGASSDPEPPPIIDATVAPSVTPSSNVFDGPAKVIDGSQPHVATLETDEGTITIELVTDAPEAVNNLAFLAAKGFYDGTALYYVDHNYVAQGGDPSCRPDSEQICTGFGDPGYVLPQEDTSTAHEQWVVAMPAVSQADSVHGSQFRVYFQADDRLDGEETVLGRVTEGQEILENLPNLKICSALTQRTDDCEDNFDNALIIEDVTVTPAAAS
jgi:cyclophilin family peptidyl-prolyl cis-trans isomerase